MKFRQGVISIYPAEGSGFSLLPKQEIIFRQPYHNFGLAFTFNFTKTFDCPFSNCDIVIHNPSNEIVNSIKFDNETYYDRPKIEIRAGESDYRLNSLVDIDILKNTLPLVYTGCPIWYVENKIIGGKSLNITLSDISAVDASLRITNQFQAGTDLISVLTQLSTFTETPWDYSELVKDYSTEILEHNLVYMAKPLYSQILPELSRIYGFTYNRMKDGTVHFVPQGVPNQGLSKGDISNLTGLIEYPTQINWVHWNVKTFYGRPFIAYPWEWVSIKASNLAPDAVKRSGGSVSVPGIMQAMVVEASHHFNDTSAEIIYKVSPSGNPVISNPIKQL